MVPSSTRSGVAIAPGPTPRRDHDQAKTEDEQRHGPTEQPGARAAGGADVLWHRPRVGGGATGAAAELTTAGGHGTHRRHVDVLRRRRRRQLWIAEGAVGAR